MRRETGLPLLWLAALTYLFVDSAFGGYRELRDALEGYRPPDYLFADEAAAPAAAPTNRGDVKAFAAERDRLTALKAHWENVLQAPPNASTFYWPQAQIIGFRVKAPVTRRLYPEAVL